MAHAAAAASNKDSYFERCAQQCRFLPGDCFLLNCTRSVLKHADGNYVKRHVIHVVQLPVFAAGSWTPINRPSLSWTEQLTHFP